MRIESTQAAGGSDPGAAQAAATAAAAAAARAAAAAIADPTIRAAAGFGLADRPMSPSASPAAQAVADASANARTAATRTDLRPEVAQQARVVVERLGNALVDGRIDPHINDSFRQHLYSLATEAPDSAAYRGAMAQLTRAAQVLDQAELATGTRLTYDPRSGQPEVARAGLPILDVPDIDADLYFRTNDGVLHIEGAKATPQTLANEVQRTSGTQPSQLQRQAAWEQAGSAEQPRSLGLYTQENGPGFNNLLDDRRLGQLQTVLGGDPSAQRLVIGDRAFSINDLRAIAANADRAAQAHVDSLGPLNDGARRDAFRDYYRSNLATTETATRNFGQGLGQSVDELRALPTNDGISLRTGALWGAAGGAAMTLVRVGLDGELNAQDLGAVTQQTALGAGVGVLTAAGERALAPTMDRLVGPAAQRAATAVAPRVLATAAAATPEAAAAFSSTARTVASRAAGATVVGTVVATGLSAYENREGLARGDSQAIGNVTADTAVALGSIAAATAAGAAAGSIVPVAGTAVGAVVGLAVGVGVAYGAQLSGARDAVANTVSGWVDGIKSWF